MADRFPLIVNPSANQIQEIPGADNIVVPGQIKLTTTAASGSNGDSTIRITGNTSNVSRLLIDGQGSNNAGSFTNIAEFKLTNTTPVVKTTGSFEGGGIIPLGGIIMWSGAATADVPDGFTLCDGNVSGGGAAINGITIPDLRDKFIVGANAVTGSDADYPGVSMNQTGGSADATLPTHFHHAFKFGNSGERQNDSSLTSSNYAASGTGAGNLNEAYNIVSKTSEADVGKTSAEGSAATNSNLPPYYALAFIIRTS